MNKYILAFLLLVFFLRLNAQIIDVHLHSYTNTDYWGGRTHPTGIGSPESADEHLQQTIALLDKHRIEFGVVSGSLESLRKYTSADSRFIPGYMDEENLISVIDFENLIKDGKIKVFGEITGVYHGRTLNDPVYEPYLKICQEYGIPVAYHTGGGPYAYGELHIAWQEFA